MGSAVSRQAATVPAVDIHSGKNSSAERVRALATALRRALREPMLHFIIGGAAIFLVAHVIEHFHNSAARAIVIDAALKNRLTKLYELQMGAPPSTAQLAQIIDSYVHDEVLYREALGLGLDKGDEIIRRRLVQKMSFLQSDLVIAAEPDEPTLRRYYDQHQADFAEPERISFQHYFFNTDSGAAEGSYRRASAALARLNADSSAVIEADRSPLDAEYQRLGRRELKRLFGATPIVEQLLSNATGAWRGPVRSGYGWHLIKVEEHFERTLPSFEAVRGQVAGVVDAQIKEENNRRNFRALLAHYEIRGAESPLP